MNGVDDLPLGTNYFVLISWKTKYELELSPWLINIYYYQLFGLQVQKEFKNWDSSRLRLVYKDDIIGGYVYMDKK